MPTLTIRGVEALQTELARLSDATDVDAGLRDTMNLAVGMLHRYATGVVHVDIGRLKNSIFPNVGRRGNDLIGLVATNVEYAPAEEARGGQHAFFERTVREEGPAINDLFSASITGRR